MTTKEPDTELCQHKTVLAQDEIGSGEGIECHRDAAGEFEILTSDAVAAVMELCPQHRDFLESKFSEVREIDA